MAERIFRVITHGITSFESHIAEGDHIAVEGDEIHIRSESQPVFQEVKLVDEATTTVRTMEPVAPPKKKSKGAVQV